MSMEQRYSGEWRFMGSDNSFSGELFVNEEKKTIFLHLVKLATENPFPSFGVIGKVMFISGILRTGAKILLYDCRVGGEHNIVGSRTEVWIRADYAFWGLEENGNECLRFKQVKVDFGEIITWSGLCKYEWSLEDMDYSINKRTLIWSSKQICEYEIDEKVTLSFEPYANKNFQIGDLTKKEVNLTQGVYVVLNYNSDTKWDQILYDLEKIRKLMSLGMRTAVAIHEILFKHEGNYSTELGYINDARCILGTGKVGNTYAIHERDYLYNLEGLLENDYISMKKWWEKYNSLKPVVDLYVSAYDYKDIPVEMLFLNLTQALETYHARFICDSKSKYKEIVDAFIHKHFGDIKSHTSDSHIESYREFLYSKEQEDSKHITLKSRLNYLFLADFRIIIQPFGFGKRDLIKKIVDTRNYYTHYNPNKYDKSFDLEMLPYVNGLLMIVISYYLMKELDIEKERMLDKVNANLGDLEQAYHIYENTACKTER